MNIYIKIKKRRCYYCLLFAFIGVYYYVLYGFSDFMYMKNFDKDFHYPLDMNIQPLIAQVLLNRTPTIRPLNKYPYKFLTNSTKCAKLKRLDLFIVVKSAMAHFDQREAIRHTYGQENIITDKIVRILFFIGIDTDIRSPVQWRIDQEMEMFKDIIQMNFIDTYYNNTIKMMMSFRWLFEHCSNADNYLFTDDDMYISVKNLFKYIENEATGSRIHPGNTEVPVTWPYESKKMIYSGFVFNSSPHRLRASKWSVPLHEYPWNRWPPYVTAGAFVVSNRIMTIMYAGSLFVKHFRFDDIYLGILAKKIGFVPTHCAQFYYYKKKYSVDGYRDVIASHGYHNPEELYAVWTEQNSLDQT